MCRFTIAFCCKNNVCATQNKQDSKKLCNQVNAKQANKRKKKEEKKAHSSQHTHTYILNIFTGEASLAVICGNEAAALSPVAGDVEVENAQIERLQGTAETKGQKEEQKQLETEAKEAEHGHGDEAKGAARVATGGDAGRGLRTGGGAEATGGGTAKAGTVRCNNQYKLQTIARRFDFSFGDKALGKGSFGVVFIAADQKFPKEPKAVKLEKIKPKHQPQLFHEYRTYTALNHKDARNNKVHSSKPAMRGMFICFFFGCLFCFCKFLYPIRYACTFDCVCFSK